MLGLLLSVLSLIAPFLVLLLVLLLFRVIPLLNQLGLFFISGKVALVVAVGIAVGSGVVVVDDEFVHFTGVDDDNDVPSSTAVAAVVSGAKDLGEGRAGVEVVVVADFPALLLVFFASFFCLHRKMFKQKI